MKFTVVIPTRDRVDTLEWSLKTCLCQDYDDFEIIVSDNASQDGTADLVGSFSDPRIHYINTGKRLGMSQNWEFALDHVKEGYVFFMGDDDGLLPNAIKKANQLLTENRVDALAWNKAFYAWPNHIDKNIQNHLVMPRRSKITIRNSRRMLQRICDFDPCLSGKSYEQLPGLYNSFVSISAINRARSKSGRFFCSQIPDVYSAIALTCSVNDYIYSDRPLSINGASGHSNGTSYFKNPDSVTSKIYLSETNIPFHSDLLLAPSIPILILESVYQVRGNVPGCGDYSVNIENLFGETVRNSKMNSEEQKKLIDSALNKLCVARGYDKQALLKRSTDSALMVMWRKWLSVKELWDRNIYFQEINLPVSEACNVYEASMHYQKNENRNRLMIFVSSLLTKARRRIFRGVKIHTG